MTLLLLYSHPNPPKKASLLLFCIHKGHNSVPKEF